MSPSSPSDRAARLWQLFHEAADLPPDERAAFLDEHCHDDDLRNQLEALLRADQHADDAFHTLDHPLGGSIPSLSNRTVSHFQIQERLGGGGMGVVYKARDLKLDRTVALKFLPPYLSNDQEATERLVQEAKAASALDHANICTIHEISETGEGQTFIAMAYYAGETLKKKIAQGPLSIDEALDYAVQMAQGLARAHEAGIVHRDVKPANVMVTDRERVKLLDFGLAKVQDVSLTKTGTTLGTVSYMSPEQARGEAVDHRTDIWSLGVVLYELLTGQRPFRGDYAEAIIYAIRNDEPEPVQSVRADVPPVLNDIVMKALAKDPDARYQQTETLLADLVHLRPPTSSGTRTATARLSGSVRRHRALIAGTLSLALVGLLAAYAFLLRPAPSEVPAEPPRKMLAVLPFQNLGPAEEEYFADGITDEITARLTGIDALGVIARSSAMQYKSTEKTIQQIGDDLGVSYILDGTVRWQHGGEGLNHVRITPQLINVSDETQLWTDSYEEALEDIFDVQSDIAERVAEALDITLLEPERQALKGRSTDDPEAYASYLQGIDAMNRWTETSLHAAIDAYEHAVALDSSFALAHARTAEAHLWLYVNYYDRSEERLDAAKAAIDRAAALDPDLAEVSFALGKYHQMRGDYDGALEQYERARQHQPGNKGLMVGIASIQRRQGDLDQAVQYLERAAALDPRDYNTQYQLAITQLVMHDYRAAERSFDRTLALVPDWFVAYLFKSTLYMSQGGQTTKAQAVMQQGATHIGLEKLVTQLLNAGAWAVFRYLDDDFQRVLEQFSLASSEVDSASTYLAKAELYDRKGNPDHAVAYYDSARVVLQRLVQAMPDDPYYRTWLGIAHAGLGHREDAVREGRKATELLPVSEDVWDGPDFLWSLAEIYMMVGDYDAAVEQLRLALSYPGIMSREWLEVEDLWDPLRERPAFQSLLARES